MSQSNGNQMAIKWHEKAFQEVNVDFERVHNGYEKQVATAPATQELRG